MLRLNDEQYNTLRTFVAAFGGGTIVEITGNDVLVITQDGLHSMDLRSTVETTLFNAKAVLGIPSINAEQKAEGEEVVAILQSILDADE